MLKPFINCSVKPDFGLCIQFVPFYRIRNRNGIQIRSDDFRCAIVVSIFWFSFTGSYFMMKVLSEFRFHPNLPIISPTCSTLPPVHRVQNCFLGIRLPSQFKTRNIRFLWVNEWINHSSCLHACDAFKNEQRFFGAHNFIPEFSNQTWLIVNTSSTNQMVSNW